MKVSKPKKIKNFNESKFWEKSQLPVRIEKVRYVSRCPIVVRGELTYSKPGSNLNEIPYSKQEKQ